MKIIRGKDLEYTPASHEDFNNPGVFKKILFQKDQLQPGRVQMINWAKLPVGKKFSAHYHEDMQEIFIIAQGSAKITVGETSEVLGRSDALLIEPREIHVLENVGEVDVFYVVVGVTRDEGGKTVIVK